MRNPYSNPPRDRLAPSGVRAAKRGTRRLAAILASGAVGVFAAGCGEQTQDFYVEPSTPENPVAQTEAAAREVADRETLPPSSPIASVGASGPSGELTVTYSAQEIELVIGAAGLPEAGEFPTHVHRGVCAEGGPVAAALTPVVAASDGSGTSTTTLERNALPVNEPLFVQIHAPSGAPIACGDVLGEGS